MNDYSAAAQEMKESIIDEYLKTHPGTKREEIITRTVNGRVIVDTINNAFKFNASKQTENRIKDQKLLKKLIRQGEEQLIACLHSVKSSKKYVDWLFTSRNTGFSQQDKEENFDYLEKKETAAGNKSIEVHNAKVKLSQMLADKVKTESSLARTLVQEYIQVVVDQLKVQQSIFGREVDLAEHFSTYAKEFIESCFSVVQSRLKPSTLNALGKAYHILKNEKIDQPNITSPENHKKFKESMDTFEEKLNERRGQLAAIQQLVNFLEEVIASMKSTDNESESKKSSSRRMAFTTRSKKR